MKEQAPVDKAECTHCSRVKSTIEFRVHRLWMEISSEGMRTRAPEDTRHGLGYTNVCTFKRHLFSVFSFSFFKECYYCEEVT